MSADTFVVVKGNTAYVCENRCDFQTMTSLSMKYRHVEMIPEDEWESFMFESSLE